MASRSLRSNSKNNISTGYSVTLRNSRNRDLSSKTAKEKLSKKIKTKAREKSVKRTDKPSKTIDTIEDEPLSEHLDSVNTDEQIAVTINESQNKVGEKGKEKNKDEMEGLKKYEDTPTDNNEESSGSVSDTSPTKRRRGRPRKRPANEMCQVNDQDSNVVCEESKIPILEIEGPLKLDVEKAVEKPRPPSPPPSPPPKRKPRMASLNALAKVNAVLENYRFEKTNEKIIAEAVRRDEAKRRSTKTASEEKRIERTISPTVEFESPAVKITASPTEKITCPPPVSLVENIDFEEEVFTPVSPPSPQCVDQDTQTKVSQRSRSQQTEQFVYPTDMSRTFCTCCRKKSIKHTKQAASPFMSGGVPLHVHSSVLAHASAHTLVLPIVKTHYYHEKPQANKYHGVTDNITSLLDRCMNKNFARKEVYPVCAKVVQVSAQKQAIEKKRKLAEMLHKRVEGKKDDGRLVIPSLYSEPISILIEPRIDDVEKRVSSKKQIIKSSKSLKFVPKQTSIDSIEGYNDCKFEGECREETYTIARESIQRRYYSILRRKGALLRVYDAVVLRSGLEGDSDYVARICSFWEDNKGPFEGEMMMSVQWYYKSEQTNSKGNEIIKGQPMEVFASRHKDDNSVACIIDRCYVVTYSQFCRFKAKKQLLDEKHRRKLYVVPEKNNSHKSRLLPTPEFDTSLVFFCRYGYDVRSGKLIKSQY